MNFYDYCPILTPTLPHTSSLSLTLPLPHTISPSHSHSHTLTFPLSHTTSSFSATYKAISGSQIKSSGSMGGTILGNDRITAGPRPLNSTASTFLNQQKPSSSSSGKSNGNNSGNGSGNDNNKVGSSGSGNGSGNNGVAKKILKPPSGKMIKRIFLFSDDPDSIEVLASEGDQALVM